MLPLCLTIDRFWTARVVSVQLEPNFSFAHPLAIVSMKICTMASILMKQHFLTLWYSLNFPD